MLKLVQEWQLLIIIQSVYARQQGAIHLNSSRLSGVAKIMVIDKMKYSQLTFLSLAENIRRIKVGYAFYFREADGGSIHGKIKDVGIISDNF